ncbi:MAG TPA: hypothetical protein VGM56_08875 [Byssovorax sp.]|jgi:hypothetical protein
MPWILDLAKLATVGVDLYVRVDTHLAEKKQERKATRRHKRDRKLQKRERELQKQALGLFAKEQEVRHAQVLARLEHARHLRDSATRHREHGQFTEARELDEAATRLLVIAVEHPAFSPLLVSTTEPLQLSSTAKPKKNRGR